MDSPGLINAGCYVLPPDALEAFPLGHPFSLENDYLAAAVQRTADYARAQQELATVLL